MLWRRHKIINKGTLPHWCQTTLQYIAIALQFIVTNPMSCIKTTLTCCKLTTLDRCLFSFLLRSRRSHSNKLQTQPEGVWLNRCAVFGFEVILVPKSLLQKLGNKIKKRKRFVHEIFWTPGAPWVNTSHCIYIFLDVLCDAEIHLSLANIILMCQLFLCVI